MQTSHSVGPYGRTPEDVKVKGPSPTLEELTVHCHSEIHTLATNYRATMLGAPQRGQLLSPSRRRLLGGHCRLSGSSPPGRKGGKATLTCSSLPATFAPSQKPLRTPEASAPRAGTWCQPHGGLPPAFPGLVLSTVITPNSCLGVAGSRVPVGSLGQKKHTRECAEGCPAAFLGAQEDTCLVLPGRYPEPLHR